MKELSVSDVMAFRPCYSKERVEELFNGKDKLSLFDILDLDIPEQDKVWVLTQPGVLSDAILKEFADLTADRAVRQRCLSCGLPAVEAWAAKWLDGSDRSVEAAEAARAAYEAAWVAQEAAWTAQAAYWAAEAAYGAALAAAYGAACNAACGVAEAAYWAACNVAKATGEAERQQQIVDLRRLIGE